MATRSWLRRGCWMVTLLFVPCGVVLAGAMLRHPVVLAGAPIAPRVIELAGITLGLVWMLLGLGCAVVASLLSAGGSGAKRREWVEPRGLARAR